MNMKHLIPVACLALSFLSVNPALAHGDVKPQYGGIVQKVNDVSFELVAQADGPRLLGRAVPGERLEIGDNVAIDSVVDGVHLFRKNS